MARETSGRVVGAFVLAVAVGFIVGVASWWLPSRGKKDAEAPPARQLNVVPSVGTRRAERAAVTAPMTWTEADASAIKSALDGKTIDPAKGEAAWDAALSKGSKVFGVASEHAFVMARADSTSEVPAALQRGDFYTSTGVKLARVGVVGERLEIDVAPESGGEHHFVFVGRGGEVLGDMRGRIGRYVLSFAPAGYVRAVVTDAQGQKAWTQPITVHGI